MIPQHLYLNVRGGLVLGGGMWQKYPPTTTPPLTFKSYLCEGWCGGGGSIKMGKKFNRIKTESWAQDVGCAYIINVFWHNVQTQCKCMVRLQKLVSATEGLVRHAPVSVVLLGGHCGDDGSDDSGQNPRHPVKVVHSTRVVNLQLRRQERLKVYTCIKGNCRIYG